MSSQNDYSTSVPMSHLDKYSNIVYNNIVRQFEQETKEPIHGSTVIGSDAYEEFLRC